MELYEVSRKIIKSNNWRSEEQRLGREVKKRISDILNRYQTAALERMHLRDVLQNISQRSLAGCANNLQENKSQTAHHEKANIESLFK